MNSLTTEETQDPFLAARWVERPKERPRAKKSGKAHKGGHTSSWEEPGVPSIGEAVKMADPLLMTVTVGRHPVRLR